ncbi:TetR/AcrR family transcriptional regulator [Nocardia otitidiscaviarum]|uniref:TetR/AcrR family transcriptional regulator n=1 Tax=Nocardia otitidiscaviarum TaxID=1823 RepID=UPI001894DBB6|nr:TetR/AcrR family transcriptional regulator [Nocardia otitidiscaviarum]MBF6180042.1 TetR/AcrR family transcriptional regulator [Nocardia otitidiscaviarum]
MTHPHNAFGVVGGRAAPEGQSSSTRARQTDLTRRALVLSGRRALALGRAERIGIASLARNAGVSTGTFYNYFDGKAQLFDAVMDEVIAEFAEILDVAAATAHGDTSSAQLRALTRLGFSTPDLASIALGQGFGLLRYPAVFERLVEPVTAEIRVGSIADRDPAMTVDFLWAAVLAALHAWQRNAASVAPAWLESLVCQTLSVVRSPLRPPVSGL